MFLNCYKEEACSCDRWVVFRYISEFSEWLLEMWTSSQSSFDMVGVFSGVIEDLTHRAKQSTTDNEASTHLVRLVEVTSFAS